MLHVRPHEVVIDCLPLLQRRGQILPSALNLVALADSIVQSFDSLIPVNLPRLLQPFCGSVARLLLRDQS